MKKTNILYFTSYPLENSDGGSMAIFNDILQLSQIEDINLYVLLICEECNQWKARIKLDKLTVKYDFLTFPPLTTSNVIPPFLTNLNAILRKLFPIKLFLLLYKKIGSSLNQFSLYHASKTSYLNRNQAEYVSKYLKNLCYELSIQTVIVEYLFSVLWFKSFLKIQQKKIYIALDREGEFFKALAPHYCHAHPDPDPNPKLSIKDKINITIMFLRIKNFERKTCKIVDKLTFMTHADVPKNLVNNRKVFINSQVFPKKLRSWKHTNSKTVFFSGNIDYYFNLVAVKWLINELSPRLLKLNNKIKIIITGTNLDDIPKDWIIQNNVHIVGFIPQEELENLFQTSDMFICPIDNDFSVKMKLVECVSYGTPFFTTDPCLKALPYLSGLPILDINKPNEAASYICDALSQKEVLEKLNKQILENAFNFNNTRKDWWKKIILDI